MPQTVKVVTIEGGNGIADGVVGHIGGVMAAGDIGIASQIFKDMGVAVLRPLTDNLTATLGPGADDHDDFIRIRQIRVIGNRLIKGMVVDGRSHASIRGFVVGESGRYPIFLDKKTGDLGQGHQILIIG